MLGPQHLLGAAAEQCKAWPARIGGDKRPVARACRRTVGRWRRMIHSTSLCAAGSEMPASICVAFSVPPLCNPSMAFLTIATSASAISGTEAGGNVSARSGSGRGSSGPEGAVAASWDSDFFFSLDFAADFVVDLAVDLCFFPACFVAFACAVTVVAVMPAMQVSVSRPAQASAATRADRRAINLLSPEPPALRPAPGVASARPNATLCTRIWAEKRRH